MREQGEFVNKLFTTNVGSHMWNMQTPESDVDLFTAYVEPIGNILVGRKPRSFHEQKRDIFQGSEVDLDESLHEIGHVVHQIAKNNVNFIWGVMGPLVVSHQRNHRGLDTLRDLVLKNLSRQIYYSIHGLAMHNFKKYIEGNPKNLSDEKLMKKCSIVTRTLRFGIAFLDGDGLVFKPIKFDDLEMARMKVVEYMHFLDQSYDGSELPEKPQHVGELEMWLVDLRLQEVPGYISEREWEPVAIGGE